MSVKLYTGELALWQWDRGRLLIVDDSDCNQVHFYNGVTPGVLAKEVREQDGVRVVQVPDILLQVARNLTVYTYKEDETSALTINADVFTVNARRKPADYIYTEDEIHTWEELEKRVKALEETGALPDESIAEAVKAYLEENPIESGATAEEAAQIEKNKEDIQNLANDKLDADKLPEAVNEALAQAKAIIDANKEETDKALGQLSEEIDAFTNHFSEGQKNNIVYASECEAGYIKESGEFNGNTDWRYTIIVLNNVRNIRFTGRVHYGATCIATFRDKNGNVLSRFGVGTSVETYYTNEIVPINTDAYDVVICWFGKTTEHYVTYDDSIVINFDKIIHPYKNKKWVCVGDSLTANNNSASEKYHKLIADELGFEVINMGDGGTGYMKNYNTGRAFYQRIANCPVDADVVTIFGSGNDLSMYTQNDMSILGEVSDATTDTVCGCINRTLDVFFDLCPTTPVGIISPTPWYDTPPSLLEKNKMEAYVSKLCEVARYRGVPFLDLYHHSNLRPENEINKNLLFANGDGVHPNNLGHKVIASKIREFVKTLI